MPFEFSAWRTWRGYSWIIFFHFLGGRGGVGYALKIQYIRSFKVLRSQHFHKKYQHYIKYMLPNVLWYWHKKVKIIKIDLFTDYDRIQFKFTEYAIWDIYQAYLSRFRWLMLKDKGPWREKKTIKMTWIDA